VLQAVRGDQVHGHSRLHAARPAAPLLGVGARHQHVLQRTHAPANGEMTVGGGPHLNSKPCCIDNHQHEEGVMSKYLFKVEKYNLNTHYTSF